MRSITEIAIKRPITTIMLFLSMFVVGSIAWRMVPLEFMPEITFPGAFIQVPYPNASPKEVEEQVVRPIEEALATISSVEQINSFSSEGNAGIVITFLQGNDINLKAIEIKEKIESVRRLLPDDFQYYQINKFADGSSNTLQLRISSERDLSNAYELLNRNVKQRIERVAGVGQVTLYGVEKKQVQIEVATDRLLKHNISINELVNQLNAASFSTSAGKISSAGIRYTVRPLGEITNAEELSDLIVAPPNIRLRDVAKVTYREPERDYARHLDRDYAIGLDIVKESSANTVETVDAILEELAYIDTLPEMQGIRIFEMNNEAEGILSSLKELFNSGILGAFLSLFMLFFFLRRLRATLIVALAVPFSLVVTLGFMFFLNMSLNILSMMGLMLAIGMLVDNAVVVTENIQRHLRKGVRPNLAAVMGAKEVGMAVTAGTLTSIVVFLPNMVNESMIKQHMYFIGMPIVISLISSLLISLTLIPLLALRMKPSKKEHRDTIIDRFSIHYARFLRWFIARRWLAGLSILALFLSVIIPASFVKVNMFEPVEERELVLRYNLHTSYTLERVKETVDTIEDYLYSNKDDFEIASVYTYYETRMAESTLLLVDDEGAEKSVEQIKQMIEEGLPKIAIGEPTFGYRDRNGGEVVRVFVQGESMQVLEELASEVARRVSGVDGFADVQSEAEAGRDEIQVAIDNDRARYYGLSKQEVAGVISSGIRGRNLRKIRGSEAEVDVFLTLQKEERENPADMQQLVVSKTGTAPVRLSELTELTMGKSPGQIVRQNRKTSLGISMNLEDGKTVEEAREQITSIMDGMQLPTGYQWSFGRSFGMNEDAGSAMLFNIIIAFVLIYLVMAGLFESLMYPASILACILFGVVGIFWFFLVTGTTFDLMATIGILILMGIVVNNGIVLIDHILHLRSTGMDRTEAIIQGGQDRMRAILMTAGTTILGLIPLSMGTTLIGGDGPPYFPMARAIVGGLSFSTVITLVVLPSIYMMLDDVRLWSARLVEES